MNKVAKQWVGYLEHQSNKDLGIFQSNIGKGYHTIFSYLIWKHYPHLNYNGFPWCATFVHAMALEAYGKEKAKQLLWFPYPGTHILAYITKWKGYMKDKDYIPEPSDLIFLHNGDGRISHCGIVDYVEGDEVISIEGNTIDPTGHFSLDQGGAVAIRRRKLNDKAIVAYGQIKARMR